MPMKRPILFLVALVLIVLLLEDRLPGGTVPELGSPPVGAEPAAAGRERRSVVRVVDGDTLLLDGRERVRLIGVDTPGFGRAYKRFSYSRKREFQAAERARKQNRGLWAEAPLLRPPINPVRNPG